MIHHAKLSLTSNRLHSVTIPAFHLSLSFRTFRANRLKEIQMIIRTKIKIVGTLKIYKPIIMSTSFNKKMIVHRSSMKRVEKLISNNAKFFTKIQKNTLLNSRVLTLSKSLHHLQSQPSKRRLIKLILYQVSLIVKKPLIVAI